MANEQTSKAIRHLRRIAILREGADLTDRQLLEHYLRSQDDTALAALVRRHAPMVWGVCSRILGNHHDAEDAFQATFLVFLRKAAVIASRELLANWLYGVARCTALKARNTAARRKKREKQVTEMPEPQVAERDVFEDLRPTLDAALSHLPARYGALIVLCDLEGKTRKEAARQLGLPEGTVASRLTRARVLLARRLAQRNVALSGGVLASMLALDAAARCVPRGLVSSTIQAAYCLAAGKAVAAEVISAKVAALTEGVLKTMLWTRLKTVIGGALMVVLLGLSGALAWQSQAAAPSALASAKEASPRGAEDDLKKKLLELDELWWKGDVATLRKLAADDLITVSGVGRYDKPSLLEAARDRHAVDWSKRDKEVSRISRDVAVVTYLYDCKIVRWDGTVLQNRRDRRLSMTWANRKGRWVVVFSHETIMPGGE
jgi:RNA polymerase sigma factor (sigma-70 family)